MKQPRAVTLLVLSALLGAACFVDIPDVVSGDAGLDVTVDAPAGDAGGDAQDVFVPPACDASCGAPAGFYPVLFEPTRTSTCPSGTQTEDLVADPGTAPSAACACGCTVSQQPSCLPTSLQFHFGTTSCTSSTVLGVTGGCDKGPNYTLAAYGEVVSPPPLDAGACSNAATPNPGVVSRSNVRVCAPTTCGASCSATGTFKVCYAAPGNVACPGGLVAHHAGTDVTVACTCAGCTMNGTCGGTVDLYGDGNCLSLAYAQNVDSTCSAQTASGTIIRSWKYIPATASCDGGAPSQVDAGLANAETICCPP